jgi:transposase
MRQKSVHAESPSERLVKTIRIVLDGLRGESSIAELCRREGIAEGLYYAWPKEFLEAGKRRLAGDTARAATIRQGLLGRRQADNIQRARRPSDIANVSDRQSEIAADPFQIL